MKLGVFVISGILFFILALYFIGSKRNLFGTTLKIHVVFANLNGLMKGNNVRFNGIDVGTVSHLEIIGDTMMRAELTIDESAALFITNTSFAIIGSDGLMGNKLVNISPGTQPGLPIKEGDQLRAMHVVELDEALRTLNRTNSNLDQITGDIRIFVKRFGAKNSPLTLLGDSTMATHFKKTILSMETATQNLSVFTSGLNTTLTEVRKGKGALGKILTDTSFSSRVDKAVTGFDQSSRNLVSLTQDLDEITSNLKNGRGSIGQLLKDTTSSHHLNEAILSLKQGAQNFNESMEALKHTWPLKRYFRNKEKKNK